MIDLRKTYCNLDSEYIDEYKDLIREQSIISIAGSNVDEMIFGSNFLCVDEYNNSHCDGLNYCLESNYTEFKGSKQAEPNKHPHHDLIIEWAKDTSKQVQRKHKVSGQWFNDPYPPWNAEHEYRLKPQRDFIDEHWYPCIDDDGDTTIYKHINGEFSFTGNRDSQNPKPASDMKWIGESLGKIKFGD